MEVTDYPILDKLLNTNNFHAPLATVSEVIEKLNIKPKYPIILVGGTNGKGSTSAYLTNILANSGYKVGTYTSPHIFRYNERICINNKEISTDKLISLLNFIDDNSHSNLGLFKTFTLACHLYFIEEEIDIAIIEVGIGGKNDVTNLFEPNISAITTIGLDHCDLLGNSLEEIGMEKAGVFRYGKPSFIGMPNPPKTVLEYSKHINTDLHIINQDFGYIKHENCFDVWCNEHKYYSLPMPGLRGDEQLANASLAIAILNKLRNTFPISINAIKTGLLQTKPIGRFQVLPGTPQIVLDVAHNPQAVSKLLENMLKLPFAKNEYAVFGVALDKDITQILKLCIDKFAKWYIAPINTTRRIDNDKLIEIMLNNKIDQSSIIACDSISSACNQALSSMSDSDRLVCFGSFLVVEEAYKTIKAMRP